MTYACKLIEKLLAFKAYMQNPDTIFLISQETHIRIICQTCSLFIRKKPQQGCMYHIKEILSQRQQN